MLNLHVVVSRSMRMRECHDNGGMCRGVLVDYTPPVLLTGREREGGEDKKINAYLPKRWSAN